MSSAEKLRLLLIRDCLSFASITAYFYIPGDYGLIAVVVALLILRVWGNKLKGATRLEPAHRKTYFVVSIAFLLLWIVLILLWIFLHLSAPAIAMGSLGILVLLAFSLYVYESVYGKGATV